MNLVLFAARWLAPQKIAPIQTVKFIAALAI
jgi:hypothetical protein